MAVSTEDGIDMDRMMRAFQKFWREDKIVDGKTIHCYGVWRFFLSQQFKKF